MKKRYRTMPIDGQKLKEQMEAAGVSASKAAKDLGTYGTYFYNAFKYDAIRPDVAIELSRLYGIDPGTYVLEKKPERGKPEQPKDESQEQTNEQGGHIPDNFTIGERQLYRIIYEAVKRATVEALGGE